MNKFLLSLITCISIHTISFCQVTDSATVADTTRPLVNATFAGDATTTTSTTTDKQERSNIAFSNGNSPYTTKLWTDGPIIAGGVGLTALGVVLISKKEGLTPGELSSYTRDKVNGFDRGNAGYYSEKADKDSYIPFQASFAMPVLLAALDKDQRKKFGQVMVLYLETMSITGALFTMTTGTVYRERPYVYGTTAPTNKRLENDARRSFFAGHTAATAAATFFTAKVYNDFHPTSAAKPFVWAAAAAVPALVGYLRYKAGMHFLSDNLIGYAVGAGVGILVPELHKNKKLQKVSFVPEFGRGYKGVALAYKL
jgi:membrane-associated phospholipid phosphatase